MYLVTISVTAPHLTTLKIKKRARFDLLAKSNKKRRWLDCMDGALTLILGVGAFFIGGGNPNPSHHREKR